MLVKNCNVIPTRDYLPRKSKVLRVIKWGFDLTRLSHSTVGRSGMDSAMSKLTKSGGDAKNDSEELLSSWFEVIAGHDQNLEVLANELGNSASDSTMFVDGGFGRFAGTVRLSADTISLPAATKLCKIQIPDLQCEAKDEIESGQLEQIDPLGMTRDSQDSTIRHTSSLASLYQQDSGQFSSSSNEGSAGDEKVASVAEGETQDSTAVS